MKAEQKLQGPAEQRWKGKQPMDRSQKSFFVSQKAFKCEAGKAQNCDFCPNAQIDILLFQTYVKESRVN